jgi:hypothetical protein
MSAKAAQRQLNEAQVGEGQHMSAESSEVE